MRGTQSSFEARLAQVDMIAAETFALLGTGRQTTPFSARFSEFGIEDAYRVTSAVRRLREAGGERSVGRKIGFTNRNIWAQYNVHAPIWGHVYDRTVHDLASARSAFSLAGLAEPRIEPEIVFGLSRAPQHGMDEVALLGCIGWVAHGFEIVQSIFPDWTFLAPDTVAAYGLHGALFIGPRHEIAADAADWLSRLSTFEIELYRNGVRSDRGRAADVLDGPVFALRHLVDLLHRDGVNPGLSPGEIITTGTLTRAFPVGAGEVWTTRLTGLPLEGACLRFA